MLEYFSLSTKWMTGCTVQSSTNWENFSFSLSMKATPEWCYKVIMYFLLAPTYWANTSINQAGVPVTPLLAGYTEPPPAITIRVSWGRVMLMQPWWMTLGSRLHVLGACFCLLVLFLLNLISTIGSYSGLLLTFWLWGSNRIQLLKDICRCMVTWCPIVKHSVSTRVQV